MKALIDATQQGKLSAKLALVASNQPDAAGLKIAAHAGIPTHSINHQNYSHREAFDTDLADIVARSNPDLIVLAGFMRILTPIFLDRFTGQLINIHPSLLPKHPGLHTHQRAIDAGDKETGATVHYVTSELDGGPPVLQARVVINPDDTPERLAARVLPIEHQILPEAARWHLEGRLKLAGNHVELDGQRLPNTGIQWPKKPEKLNYHHP